MKSIAVPCPCGKKVQIILHEGKVFVAHEPTKSAPAKIKHNGGAEGDTPYPCKECGRVFFSAQGLGKHRGAAHNVPGINAKKGKK